MPSNSEPLVAEALKRTRERFEVKAIPSPQNSSFDAQGIDILVRILSYPFWLAIQVKPSKTGETLGVVLPLHPKLPTALAKRLTDYMKREIKEHTRKHPSVCHILFVGAPNSKRPDLPSKSKTQIFEDILREIEKMFKITAKRVIKKSK